MVNDLQFQGYVDTVTPPIDTITPGGNGNLIDGGSPTTTVFDSVLNSGEL